VVAAAVGAVALLGIVGAGCSSSDGGGTTGTTPNTGPGITSARTQPTKTMETPTTYPTINQAPPGP